MKKFLLTLIVTMLTAIGAWAQEATIEQLISEDGNPITTTESSPLVLDVNNTSGVKIYVKATGPGGFWVAATGNSYVSASSFDWQGQYGANGYFKIIPQNAGTGKVTVDVMVNEYPGGVQTPVSKASADLWVKVVDSSKADVLTFADGTDAKTIEVAKGYPVTVPVTVDPETAVLNLDKTSESGISASYDATDKEITITATEEAVEGTSTATFTLSDGVKSITLTANVVAPTPVTAVTIDPTEIKIARGKTATFTATTDGADKRVTWSVDASGVLELTGDGTIRALEHGIGTITATAVDDSNNASATATVKVTDMFPLVLTEPFEKIHIGESITAGFAVPDFVNSDYYTISYSSSKPSVLTVDDEGRVTGVSKGVSEFTVTVTPTTAGEAALWEESVFKFNVVVSQAEYSLTLTPNAAAFDLNGATETQGTTFLPMVYLNGMPTDKVSGTDYTIAYALESPFAGVSVANNGAVSVETEAKYGIATIVATLVPIGANAADYVGATAKFNVTVTNSGAGATITKNAAGNFTLSIPSAGAFFGTNLSYNPSVTYVGFADNDDAATNIAEFKAATTISIEGVASNADVQEFTHLVGSSSNTGTAVIDLDMGGLVLTEAVKKEGNSHSFIHPDEFWSKRLYNVRNLTMPRPSLTAENGTIIPADFDDWFGKNNEPYINSLVITEGWTEIGANAFNRGKMDKGHLENSLESIKFPSTLKYIRENAFAWLQCSTVIFPASLEVIEQGAFSSDPSALKDVFFTGRIAPRYVDAAAFGAATQISNNAYNNPTDGTSTRENYQHQSGWECMLHYPSGLTDTEKATYEDPTRVYELGDRIATGIDPVNNWGAGSNMYKVTPAWNNPNIALTNLKAGQFGIDPTMEAGFRDLAVGTAYIWPSVQQFRAAYVIAQNGYHWDGTEMTDEEKDRIGIYSFVFAKGDATPHHNEEDWILPYKYEQDNWWTICLPFDMSVEKVQEVFGPDTELCLFSKVIRDTETGKLRLEFKRSVMNDSYAKGDDKGAGLKAHTPYMIRPAGVIETEKESEVFTLDGYRKVKGFEIKEGDAIGFSVVAEDENGTKLKYEGHDWNYTFIGNYQENYYIPQYSYFLSWSKNNPTHRYFFEQGTTRAFNPYTCVVRAYRGGEDNVAFFDGGKSSSAKFASFFGLAEDEANKIEDMEIVCGNRGNDKVYTINGQLVNGSVLAPGLYIKNGKKFVVK